VGLGADGQRVIQRGEEGSRGVAFAMDRTSDVIKVIVDIQPTLA